MKILDNTFWFFLFFCFFGFLAGLVVSKALVTQDEAIMSIMERISSYEEANNRQHEYTLTLVEALATHHIGKPEETE